MIFHTLLNPAVWLMRRMRFAGKLILLAALSALPLLAVAWQLLVGSEPGADLAGMLWVSILSLLLLVYFFLAFYSSVVQDLGQVMRATEKMVGGDLRIKLTVSSGDELGSLAIAMGKLGSTLSGMVANVRSNAAFVAHSGKSLAAGNRDLSDRTEQQAANLEQTAASVEQLSSTVQGNASTASQTNAQAAQVRDAAVEAARAGESGRGFAVVAAEVRSLAQRSAESAKEIRLLIATSSSQVSGSVQKIRAAGSNLTQIVSGIRDVATNMSQLSSSSAEQSSGLTEITSAVRQLDEITQRNALMVGRAVTQAVNLEGRASTLVQSVASFKPAILNLKVS